MAYVCIMHKVFPIATQKYCGRFAWSSCPNYSTTAKSACMRT